MYYSTKVKTLVYVSSFICLLCVQLFTAVEVAVLCTLASALKSNMAAISMEMNRREIFFSTFFILIIWVLGRILKVGVQNLKQGVQVQWTTISDVSVGLVCHVAGQFCAVAI